MTHVWSIIIIVIVIIVQSYFWDLQLHIPVCSKLLLCQPRFNWGGCLRPKAYLNPCLHSLLHSSVIITPDLIHAYSGLLFFSHLSSYWHLFDHVISSDLIGTSWMTSHDAYARCSFLNWPETEKKMNDTRTTWGSDECFAQGDGGWWDYMVCIHPAQIAEVAFLTFLTIFEWVYIYRHWSKSDRTKELPLED